MLMDMSVTVH